MDWTRRWLHTYYSAAGCQELSTWTTHDRWSVFYGYSFRRAARISDKLGGMCQNALTTRNDAIDISNGLSALGPPYFACFDVAKGVL